MNAAHFKKKLLFMNYLKPWYFISKVKYCGYVWNSKCNVWGSRYCENAQLQIWISVCFIKQTFTIVYCWVKILIAFHLVLLKIFISILLVFSSQYHPSLPRQWRALRKSALLWQRQARRVLASCCLATTRPRKLSKHCKESLKRTGRKRVKMRGKAVSTF